MIQQIINYFTKRDHSLYTVKLKRHRQVGICEFEASVIYGASSQKVNEQNESLSHVNLTSEETDCLTPVEKERTAWKSRMV